MAFSSVSHSLSSSPVYQTEQSGQLTPTAVFLMGGPGSGKSVIRDGILDQHPEYVVLDPDLMKEQIPLYQELVKKGDPSAATQVHSRSLMMRDELLAQTQKEGRSYIFDGAGSMLEFQEHLMQEAKRLGYRVELIFVDTPAEVCLERCQKRGVVTGRMVPEEMILRVNHAARENWPRLKESADSWRQYDNSGATPLVISSSAPIVKPLEDTSFVRRRVVDQSERAPSENSETPVVKNKEAPSLLKRVAYGAGYLLLAVATVATSIFAAKKLGYGV